MSEPAIRLDSVGKMYKIFSSRAANLKDALGLPSIRRSRYSEFWAVRDIDLQLERGQRLGIIGRNGAGKSTILKLITQNVTPSEGTVSVKGQVQALLDTGGGLHPEFTGEENIEASLTFLGLSPAEIERAKTDIAEFTELGRFLSQPFKTYSTGMQARLAFAIATTIQPEILIVDEILGAGDAYFFGKSIRRMQRLLESGASVLLVSHALDQIVRFCDEAIWLDRGRIVMRGQSTEVVKAYEKFIRDLDDRRLRAKNQKATIGFDAFARDTYTAQLLVEVTPRSGALDVSTIELVRDGVTEDSLAIGAPQDVDGSQSAILLPSGWSDPVAVPEPHRAVVQPTTGQALFNLWFLYSRSDYEVRVRSRGADGGRVRILLGTRIVAERELDGSSDWAETRLPLLVEEGQSEEREETALAPAPTPTPTPVSRWPGEGTFRVERVELVDGAGTHCAVFDAGSELAIRIRAIASTTGEFPVTPAATIYRADGILVTNLVGPSFDVDAVEAEAIDFQLAYGDLNLGNGAYTVSIALYRSLSHLEQPEVYDLLDRSYEFEVRGNAPFDNGVFRHEPEWRIERQRSRAPEAEPTAT